MNIGRVQKWRRLFGLVLLIASALSVIGFVAISDPALEVQLRSQSYVQAPDRDKLERLLNSIQKLFTAYRNGSPVGADIMLKLYEQEYAKLDKLTLFKLPEIKLLKEFVTDSQIPFQSENKSDANFLAGAKYIGSYGEVGTLTSRALSLVVQGREFAAQIYQVQPTIEPKNEITFSGSKPESEISQHAEAKFPQLIAALQSENEADLRTLAATSEPTIAQLRAKPNYQYILERLSFKSMSFKVAQVPDNVTEVPVAEISLAQTDCNADIKLKLAYLPANGSYVFQGLADIFDAACAPGSSNALGASVTVLNCTDCWLAPVDKIRRLTNTYVPATLTKLNLSGGGSLTAPAAQAATTMFQEATAQGVAMRVVSSYRSYADQQATFSGWVQSEMSQGYSRTTAESRANVYSARPGHSEHQLGTVLDIACLSCTPFDNSVGNLGVYNFLATNAHKYGFVISYPQNTQHLTGYKYEPWHIRYIGKDLATELFNTGYTSGNGNYLAEFLTKLK